MKQANTRTMLFNEQLIKLVYAFIFFSIFLFFSACQKLIDGKLGGWRVDMGHKAGILIGTAASSLQCYR